MNVQISDIVTKHVRIIGLVSHVDAWALVSSKLIISDLLNILSFCRLQMVQSTSAGTESTFGGSNNLTLRGYCISSEPEQMRLFVARREGLYRLNPANKVEIKKNIFLLNF